MSANKCEPGGSVYMGCALEVDYFGDFSILLDIPRQIYAGKARYLAVSHKRWIESKVHFVDFLNLRL